jgi:uncharacterized repeat protein (TIGR01451 family)
MVLGLLVLGLGAPAWAAPPASRLYQTVPRATPTSDGGASPTATPLSDEEDEENEGDEEEAIDPGMEEGGINAIFGATEQEQPVEDEGEAAYTAVVTVGNLNLREGPGTNMPIVGAAAAEQTLTIYARNEDGSWWYACCAAGSDTLGWVSAALVEPNFDRSQSINLLPLFGTEAPVLAASNSATPAAPAVAVTAGGPLEVSFSLSPAFAWQGQTTTIRITVANPNNVAVTNVELSDELPRELAFISAEADAGGTVRNEATSNGGVLIRAQWASLPPDGSVSATITAQISPDLPDGAVVDNLVAVRSANAAYTTSAIIIGMPPAILPDF